MSVQMVRFSTDAQRARSRGSNRDTVHGSCGGGSGRRDVHGGQGR